MFCFVTFLIITLMGDEGLFYLFLQNSYHVPSFFFTLFYKLEYPNK